MKRILIPPAENATFFPSLPESATSALAANEILRIGNPVAILLEESLPKAEEWAEDTAALIEEASSSVFVDFQTFDLAPLESNPDAFERTCANMPDVFYDVVSRFIRLRPSTSCTYTGPV